MSSDKEADIFGQSLDQRRCELLSITPWEWPLHDVLVEMTWLRPGLFVLRLHLTPRALLGGCFGGTCGGFTSTLTSAQPYHSHNIKIHPEHAVDWRPV